MKKKTVITTEKHEVWIVRHIADTRLGEQDRQEKQADETSTELLSTSPENQTTEKKCEEE
jgi:hypothetical protein